MGGDKGDLEHLQSSREQMRAMGLVSGEAHSPWWGLGEGGEVKVVPLWGMGTEK